MELRVIDFQDLTSHYKNYISGVNKIEESKREFIKKIEPIKNKINEIIKESNSKLDEDRQKRNGELFQSLQQELISMDADFKSELKKSSTELNEKSYDELSLIIKDWSIRNEIDMVIGKMEVVFCEDFLDSTSDIIEILKEMELYTD